MTLIISQSLLICYVLLGFTSFPKAKNPVATGRHPLHLSSMELNYTTKGETIEISCRLFTDDLENALSKQFKVPTDLSAPSKHKEMDALLRKYIALHVQLKGNGKALGLNYIGFEKEREAIIVYIESVPVKALKKLAINNSLMYDLFDDQTNIMHMHYNGERKSTKLDYPNSNTVLLDL
ncbi:hypothetical protein AAKU52_000627 [Pedobacter sp. CG_S7]|uniref:DUF6702 family protein n=1 Tax=Pedobacter sp. CG_S7 TaxID=3143930 RepID=UPI003398AEDA